MRATELHRQNCHPGLHTLRIEADIPTPSAEHADIIEHSAIRHETSPQDHAAYESCPVEMTASGTARELRAGGRAEHAVGADTVGPIRIPVTSRLKTISLWGTKGLWLSFLLCLLGSGLPSDLRAETCALEQAPSSSDSTEQTSAQLWPGEDQNSELSDVSDIEADSSSTRGYWKFNGNLADSSTWGNHAAMDGAIYGGGRSGQALMLSGKTGPVVPFSESLSMRTGFSVDLWFKVRGLDQTTTLLGSGTLSSGDYNWAVGIQGGKVQVRYRGEDGLIGGLEYPEKGLPLNTWIHLNAWLSLADGELGLVLADDSVITSQYVTVLPVPSLRAQPQGLIMGEGLKGSLDEVRLNAL